VIALHATATNYCILLLGNQRHQLDEWFSAAEERFKPQLREEPSRLIAAKEYRAAIISAISLLEVTLRQRLTTPSSVSGRRITLTALVEEAKAQGILGNVQMKTLLEWLRTRNQVVHGSLPVPKSTAERIVNGVLEIVNAAD
jgi:hypothetical protein